MAEDKLFSGESKNIEYKVTVPEKSEKYMKTVVAFANGRGGRIYAEGTDLEGQNRYFDSEICQNMPVSDSEIEELCKSMKETALKNTWQDSEKAKIKDVTKNTLISWGVLKDAEGKIYPTNAYALLTGKMPQMPVIQCGVFKGTNRAHFVDRREFEGLFRSRWKQLISMSLKKSIWE